MAYPVPIAFSTIICAPATVFKSTENILCFSSRRFSKKQKQNECSYHQFLERRFLNWGHCLRRMKKILDFKINRFTALVRAFTIIDEFQQSHRDKDAFRQIEILA